MDLKGILAISGYRGLFKLVKQTQTGFIVESLLDGKRMQAFASSKISTLTDIAIYTEDDEVPLKELLVTIFKQNNQEKLSITSKSSAKDLKDFFAEVLPNYDKERVYVSDIKKIVTWYNLLVENNLIDLKEEEKEEKVDDNSTENEEETSTDNKPKEDSKS